MWIVYVIQHNLTKEIYVGKTANLKQRLSQHNAGQQLSTKRKNGKWVLVYAEAYRSKESADTREARLKYHGSAIRELKKRIQISLL